MSKNPLTLVNYDGADVTRTCARKSVFHTEADARSSARKVMSENLYAEVVVYGCIHCGLWHIGRRSGSTPGPQLTKYEPPTQTEEEPLRRRATREELLRGRRRRHSRIKGQ